MPADAHSGPGTAAGGVEPHAGPFETRPFSEKVLFRRMQFGATLGTTTGAMYGGWDAYRNVQRQKLAGAEARRYGVAHTAKACAWFGGYFALFQSLKYGLVVVRKEDDLANSAIAGVGAMAPFARTATFRSNLPYAVGLLILDAYHDNKFGTIDTSDHAL